MELLPAGTGVRWRSCVPGVQRTAGDAGEPSRRAMGEYLLSHLSMPIR